jgi:hypothetical protein
VNETGTLPFSFRSAAQTKTSGAELSATKSAQGVDQPASTWILLPSEVLSRRNSNFSYFLVSKTDSEAPETLRYRMTAT